MATNPDFTDLNIKYVGHPRYSDGQLVEDDVINVVVGKIEMILFTNKGDVLGDPNFGGDLELYLHQTKVSSEFVRKKLLEQFQEYIPELNRINYTIEISFSQNPDNPASDIMFIDINLDGVEISAFID